VSERDELAALIVRFFGDTISEGQAKNAASVAINAGYRKQES